MNDIAIGKIQNIQRCVRRAKEEYQENPEGFATDFTRQDAAILNVIRACETTIDLANHTLRAWKLGIPTSSRESFQLLNREGIIDDELAESLEKMVGFRNMVIHQYTKVDVAIVESVIDSELDELLAFAEKIREYLSHKNEAD
jgi:uncharacterized protein YutE (UPF0331/DUF86 family)